MVTYRTLGRVGVSPSEQAEIKGDRPGVKSQVRPNKLFPPKNVRLEMAQEERKKDPEMYFLPTCKS
jgi:hypothetical protein